MRPLAAPEKSLRNVVENKYMKGGKIHELWSFPSGKVDKGETIDEAAVREAKEESGYFA